MFDVVRVVHQLGLVVGIDAGEVLDYGDDKLKLEAVGDQVDDIFDKLQIKQQFPALCSRIVHFLECYAAGPAFDERFCRGNVVACECAETRRVDEIVALEPASADSVDNKIEVEQRCKDFPTQGGQDGAVERMVVDLKETGHDSFKHHDLRKQYHS
ncbi:hypothetical protein OGATHE_003074 [Ogataea polymorpha]|uniref:Uncharacterized protein n=1 Tax=Ogataea polymorpha TaxID=460523 RepID=A0A9P8T731_9ASCO|nr:hypothetical protein OGATHE_003074 [Ogataea polymorpha]